MYTKKIAIVRRNGLGDLMCTVPTLLYLQKGWPEAQITLFVDETNAGLMPYLPSIHEVVVFKQEAHKYLDVLGTAWKYRSERFDIALSAKTSPMRLMNLFLFALGAKERRAYVERTWSAHFVNAPTPYVAGQTRLRHQALQVLQLIAPHLQAVPEELFPKIVPAPRHEGVVRVLLSASTTNDANRLDVSKYAQIVNHLAEEGIPFHVHVLSLEGDRLRAMALAHELQCPYTLHFPQRFQEFMGVIEQTDLIFCGDGGIGHIGAAMGKRVVVLFGETLPLQWAPLGPHVTTLYDCSHVNRLADEKIEEILRHQLHEVAHVAGEQSP